MTEHGYIAVARSLIDHPVVGMRGKFSRTEAWLWLLVEARWKPCRYTVGSVSLNLQRGQLAHSTRYMAKAWGWPETNVRRFLACLKTGAMIGAETGAGATIITICNYDTYQVGGDESGAATGALAGAQVAQKRRKKERKNNNNALGDENFSAWYSAYPRKKQPKDACRAYGKVMATGEISHADLKARTLAFSESVRRKDKKFIPYPASWLNAGGYLDEPDDAPTLHHPAIEAPSRAPDQFTDSDWRDLLATFRGSGAWSETYWGPRPGDPGCLVPRHLLVAPVTDRALAVGGEHG